MALLSRAQHKYEYTGQACLVPYVLCWYYRFSHCTNFLCEILAALALLFFLLRFLTPPTFTWRFKKILKANDLPTDLNVHSLRHTAASLFITSGTDVGTVAGLLGHSQPSTTLDIYTHAFDKNKKPQARSCRAAWRSELPAETLYPVALCSKSKESKHYHIKMT